MPKFSIQFHAVLDDLVDLVRVGLRMEGVSALAVRIPFEVEPLTHENVVTTLALESVRSVVFLQAPAALGAATLNQLLDQNPNNLTLDIGRLHARGLEESCLSTMDSTPSWKRVADELKRRTRAGAWGTHETTGATAQYRNHRFTPAAVAMANQGIALRPFAQSPVVLRPA